MLGYYLQHNSGFGSSFQEPGIDIAYGTNSYTVENLIAGATYKFRITSHNVLEAQNSFSWDVLNFSDALTTVAANEPDKITVFSQSLQDYESGKVKLIWDAPNDNGSQITHYTVTRDVGSGVFFVVYEGSSPSYTDTNLVAGASYSYKVTASNIVGAGEESDVLITTASSIPG